MPEHLPPDLIDLRHRVESLARDVLVPLVSANDAGPATAGTATVPTATVPTPTVPTANAADTAAVVAASRAAGVFALTQPPEHGGTGGSALALVVARETLGRHNVGHLPGLFGPSPGLLATADEPIRSAYLQPMLAGEKRGAFAFTEPDGAPRHTWATIDGDHLVVNGAKSYVTGGGDADFMNTLVEVEGSGPSMVIIDTDAEGVELTRRFGSLDGSHHAAFRFDDVRVPLANVVGAAGEGMKRAMTQVTGVRMAIAANCTGLSAFVTDFVGDYLSAPHRSGRPLGSVERHRLRYGQLRIGAYAARSTLYRTGRLIDSGDPGINEAMAAKVFATETVGDLVDTAIQIVGGQALTDDHPLVAVYRRVRALRLAEGTTDVLALNVARGHLDLDQGRL